MKIHPNTIAREKIRIEREYRRRESETKSELYAPWQPAENFILFERKSVAAFLLNMVDKFPQSGDKCLEIGFGRIGWLADLLAWGLRESDLHGIELDAKRGAIAIEALPAADLRIGDATNLPWEDETFDFIIASTVFSSILNLEIRAQIAAEIQRVLRRGGVLLWYDLAVNNPQNLNVKKITANELKNLFPTLQGTIKSITLAPPIARFVVPRSRIVATLLNAIPFLRTHLLGILIKNRLPDKMY